MDCEEKCDRCDNVIPVGEGDYPADGSGDRVCSPCLNKVKPDIVNDGKVFDEFLSSMTSHVAETWNKKGGRLLTEWDRNHLFDLLTDYFSNI